MQDIDLLALEDGQQLEKAVQILKRRCTENFVSKVYIGVLERAAKRLLQKAKDASAAAGTA